MRPKKGQSDFLLHTLRQVRSGLITTLLSAKQELNPQLQGIQMQKGLNQDNATGKGLSSV